ncbi:hypothetical protein CEXT_563341 [Caerostris extrusa]|uniref:Uncharacterized protein n=1 Tax=Caerostris extrusa TaxID=172846 RepID=A0AAV4UJF9_CAEEX|nr:hypothetical protein CEXT_563341 [Caerostris extrusa]
MNENYPFGIPDSNAFGGGSIFHGVDGVRTRRVAAAGSGAAGRRGSALEGKLVEQVTREISYKETDRCRCTCWAVGIAGFRDSGNEICA